MENEFIIHKIKAKEISHLIVTTGTNSFQYRIPRNLKLSHVPSILAEIKGEDIDITSDSDNDEGELEIL